MKRKTRIAASSVALVAGLALAGAFAQGAMASTGTTDTEGSEVDAPITGAALVSASEAAIAHLGGGRVTDTEVGDEESYYEVEVTLADGSEVDVQLDRSFAVVGAEPEATD